MCVCVENGLLEGIRKKIVSIMLILRIYIPSLTFTTISLVHKIYLKGTKQVAIDPRFTTSFTWEKVSPCSLHNNTSKMNFKNMMYMF